MNGRRLLAVFGVAWLVIGLAAISREFDASRNTDSRRMIRGAAGMNGILRPVAFAAAAQPPTYVGREACRECHAENFAMHSRHGHASTFHLVRDTELPAKFGGKSFDGGQGYGTYKYRTDDRGDLFVTLPERFGDEPFPLQYALGSGHNAQTMLTLAPAQDGPNHPVGSIGQTEAIEHRITCYADGHLGLTPGHGNKQPRSALEYFGDSSRGMPMQRCIYCHTTHGYVADQRIVDLVANVNCEKCHGPGSEHVRLARIGPNPPPFSVGQASWDTESEIQLCGDCHRLPRSVSEKEIREYPDVLARFQPIGLLRSRCYLETGRSLKCTTCHNPHRSLNEIDDSKHVSDCVNCHRQNESDHVACPVSPETGCIECHMPTIELDQGLKFHDHWIRVRQP